MVVIKDASKKVPTWTTINTIKPQLNGPDKGSPPVQWVPSERAGHGAALYRPSFVS